MNWKSKRILFSVTGDANQLGVCQLTCNNGDSIVGDKDKSECQEKIHVRLQDHGKIDLQKGKRSPCCS
jgi:hypothetical protein